MTKIKIGADELILWLRKNRRAQGIPNDEIHGLGIKIQRYIVDELKGKQLENETCYWANFMDDKNIDKINLPKTATQYEIDTSDLKELYEKMDKW